MGTLNIDLTMVDRARSAARVIAEDTQKFIDQHTTVSTERSVARLLQIDGVNRDYVPYPNVVVDHLVAKNLLGYGAFNAIVDACVAYDLTPQQVAERIETGDLDIALLPVVDQAKRAAKAKALVASAVAIIDKNRNDRTAFVERLGENKTLIYVIVATGNIYEDLIQAKAAARQGADIISVIRTTAQSLLDYVPYGATTEGFGGTYATQENFRLMREAVDEVSEELGRYIRVCNFCSGLCMPEIATMGALERLDVMLNDALYGILFRDINMKRTLVDQYFSRMVNGYAGIVINTGEDNYLTTSDAFEKAHTVVSSQFLNEQFAKLAGLPDEQIGLGHAYEMDPEIPGAFMLEWAQAQSVRQMFPNAAVKFMPPTKHMTGNIFKGFAQNTMFNAVTTLTNQKIHLLGMLTEAIHTPFMSDRALAIENARYVAKTLEGLSDEIEFKAGGKMEQRANTVLQNAVNLLETIQEEGLFNSLAKGRFASVKRTENGGKGLDGVFIKEDGYENPFIAVFNPNKEVR